MVAKKSRRNVFMLRVSKRRIKEAETGTSKFLLESGQSGHWAYA